MAPSLHREHALERHKSTLEDVVRNLDARLQIAEAIAELFEGVTLHIRALAAVAVLVGNEEEALVGRQPPQ
jgi:hypothetical protein